ncbi:hypothetical protein B0I35DRAFT_426221 [Stachybotrys elegans]|uniref:Uncharacterized protein n=1 Tax=Stachybotrys elegans TaxID=80388 RepID=A0A8K0SW07_9HYPO|nr:hypothetical protein B0I35DRAFT_426221 [Stachybotrys elegans]
MGSALNPHQRSKDGAVRAGLDALSPGYNGPDVQHADEIPEIADQGDEVEGQGRRDCDWALFRLFIQGSDQEGRRPVPLLAYILKQLGVDIVVIHCIAPVLYLSPVCSRAGQIFHDICLSDSWHLWKLASFSKADELKTVG